jgi:SMP-30/Gluconolactonase/LRE-like region
MELQLPALFTNTPIAIVPARTIAEFPANTFLESIVVAADNTLFITSHYEGKVMRIGADGVPVTHAIVAGKATGLAVTAGGDLLLSGWDDRETPVLWRITSTGEVRLLATLPDASFLNGVTRLSEDLYLIADSYRGAIWLLDVVKGQVQLWLEHPLLARNNPENPVPGVNGLKIFDRVLYASNTQNTQLIRIPLNVNNQPGQPEVFVQNVNIDDFAFDVAGNLYGATHFYNSLVRIAPDGSIVTISQLEQGMAGSTAVAFGRGENHTNLYVTTNGGMSLPPATGVETAKVVQLQVGTPGLPLT